MSKYPEHDKEFFYKFADMDTAKLILETQKFRFSSPLTFNDPFDIQTELFFNFNISDLPERVTSEVHAIVTGQRKVELSGNSDWIKATSFLREKHLQGEYRREHLDFLVKPLIEHLTSVFEESRRKYNEHWKNLLKRIKVFCVSENSESILMWSHYAKYHTGLCFKLKVLPEKDNPICAAQKVDYLSSPPSFFSLEEWVDSIVLDNEVDFSGLNYRYPLAKSDVWKYEHEWRVWAPFDDNGKKYLDMSIIEGEIDSIYFGANADPSQMKELVSISKKHGIRKFYKASKAITTYGINYHQI